MTLSGLDSYQDRFHNIKCLYDTTPYHLGGILPQNSNPTEGRLGFANDFGITVVHNAVATFLASALYRRHSPPENIQNGGCSGG